MGQLHAHHKGPRHTVRARRRRGLWVGTASVLAASGLVTGFLVKQGKADTTGAIVTLLPNPTVNQQDWAWTSSCYLVPAAAPACAKTDPNIGHAQLAGDIWNLGAPGAPSVGPGSLDMAVGPAGPLLIRGRLPSSPPCTTRSCVAPSANTWVRGYPSILYGLDQCTSGTSPPVSGGLPLPMKVSAIPGDLIGTTKYRSQVQRVTYDLAYDLWLNPSATRTPCHAGGTVEIMVWTDYDQLALLPGSMQAETATVPFAVNGAAKAGTNAWSVYTSNIYQGGQTAPWGGTIWLVLDRSDTVKAGKVSVDLSTVLSVSAELLQQRYGWGDFARHYWLDTVPFGIEFGPGDGAPQSDGPSYFSLELSSYCLAAGKTVAAAGC